MHLVAVVANLIASHVALAVQIVLHDVVRFVELALMVSHIHISILLAHDFRLPANGIEAKGNL